jgi:hypothetical protein
MSTPEGKVKDFIKHRMEGWFPSAFKYSPPGGKYGKAGMPDHIWFIKATDESCVVVAIEAKAEGNTVTPLQLQTLTKFKQLGCVVAIVEGKDEEIMLRVKNEVLRRLRVANA